ncbi:MAG TPA: hypothetical protein IAD11_06210 [Candidatus Stercorousia faecigallinarum]|nr:hypothetical protein [Candidatus Stercorousia faecigallinarum]
MKFTFLQKSISWAIALLICAMPVFALDLDTSVDDEIRRTYDPSKLEQSLPSLPKTAPSQNTSPKNMPAPQTPPKSLPVTPDAKPQIGVKKFQNDFKYDKSTAIRIKKGTKFRVKSNSVISDYLKEGARVSFTSVKPVTQRYVTITEGTRFTAVVKNSHMPQFTGNGGLIVLMVDSMTFNGQTRSVHAKITKANLKKIFFNNIKGKRAYWKGVAKQIDKGENFYKKTRRTSRKLADNPVGILISPIPTITGILVYAVNFAGSPLFAIWYKGGRISIPAGSEFEIKLLEDVYLY